MTLSPYWWPDSTKTDGLPYIRKDGERNPKFMNTLNVRMPTVLATLPTVWAYSITSPEKKSTPKPVPIIYEHGYRPEIGMNPNMTYAQSVPE
jgi:hypothetical protein